MKNLKLRQLEIVYNLASTKNFTRTADLLHMTQPGVSAHIKKAEEILKTTLFKRNKSDLIVTSACQNILDNIEDVFQELSIIESKTQSKKIPDKDLTGTLKFTLSENLSLWGNVFQDYKKKYPKVSLEVYKSFFTEQHKKISSEEVDIALSSHTWSGYIEGDFEDNYKKYIIGEYNFVIIAAKGVVDYSQTKDSKFNLDYLSGFTWIGAKGGGTEKFFLEHKVDINLIYTNDLDFLISAVVFGVGIARVPYEYLRLIDKNLYDILPVDETFDSICKIFNSYMYILDRLKQPILIQSFLDHIKSYNKF